jgi:glyoxylase-like metal-dependent hydrolase (beta-lactamase superfamily II)
MMQVHTLFTGIANTHILAAARGIVVVDAGMPHQANRILRKIHALGHSPQDVRLILITHGHIDHAGSALALKRAANAPIALHRGDARLVATPDLKIPPGRNGLIDAGTGVLKKFGWLIPLETFTPDVWLDDGQALN